MRQERLADLLERSNTAISNWENGISDPDLKTLIRLCEIFNTDLNTLITGDARKYSEKRENSNIAEPAVQYAKNTEGGILEALDRRVTDLEQEVRRLTAILEKR